MPIPWPYVTAPGNTLGGFSVRFDFLGLGTPGSRRSDIVDPNDYPTPLDRERTLVPEPETFLLVRLGLAALAGMSEFVKRGDRWRRAMV